MKINCLVVDDEQPAREILINYIGKLPSLQLVATCPDPFSALQILQFEKVDLVFIDIQMPGLNGIQFINNLSNPPKIIFTTAFSEYAVDGFELGATDYLLKPFSFERFIKAISRILPIPEGQDMGKSVNPVIPGSNNEPYKSHLFLKADKVLHKVDTRDILFLNSYGNYTKVFTREKTLLVHETLSSFEARLNPLTFVRVHKSYLVSIERISKVEGNRVIIDKHAIPVGEAFRRDLQSKLS